MNIFWACVLVALGKVTVYEVSGTKEGCEAISKQYPNSICFPVNVRDIKDAQTQVEAINTVIKG